MVMLFTELEVLKILEKHIVDKYNLTMNVSFTETENGFEYIAEVEENEDTNRME